GCLESLRDRGQYGGSSDIWPARWLGLGRIGSKRGDLADGADGGDAKASRRDQGPGLAGVSPWTEADGASIDSLTGKDYCTKQVFVLSQNAYRRQERWTNRPA